MERDLILVVEDNNSILFNLTILLEQNDYKVITATNGKIALDLLQNSTNRPDLIISDIIMPEMDGYELLNVVSSNTNWNMIPFIFLSAKATPEEVRFGKLLGVDDYLTKPIDEELLLSIIKSKIHKVRQIEVDLKTKIESELFTEISQIISQNERFSKMNNIQLFFVRYNEKMGLNVLQKGGIENNKKNTLEPIIIKLFQITDSLFNQQEIISPNSMLLDLKSINMKCLIFFNQKLRFSEKNIFERFMICIIAPEITYLDSLQLRDTLYSFANEYKNYGSYNLEIFYNEIQSFLS